jgi:hypothetical protein
MDRSESNKSGGFNKDSTVIITAWKTNTATDTGSSGLGTITMQPFNGLYMDFFPNGQS